MASFDEEIAKMTAGMGFTMDDGKQLKADESLVDDDEKPPKADGLTVEQKLQQLDTTNKSGKILADLLADPDFAQLYAAKQSGKKVVISDAEAQPPKQQQQQASQSQQIDWDNATPQQIAEYTRRQTLEDMKTLLPDAIKGSIDPIRAQLEQVNGYVSQQVQNDARKQIESVKAKYADFDQYIEPMRQIYQQNPGLNAEELYLLATTRAGRSPTLRTETDTERPNNPFGRPPQRAVRKQPLEPGVAGFRSSLDKALSNLDIDKLSNM